VIVSNKRPIQVYSNRAIELFRLKEAEKIQISGLGAAIPTALRVARFVVRSLHKDPGWKWKIVSDVIEESKVTVIDKKKPEIGEIMTELPTGREVNRIVVELVRIFYSNVVFLTQERNKANYLLIRRDSKR
jgi:replicative superfamily II helicase